ncbi:MAG: ABC transporter permease [Actinomycetia bacterium]|nr:ABC transporter permease [Actinomycetes bacterium]
MSRPEETKQQPRREPTASLPPARLAPGDATRVAVEGMRARPLRAALSGLGIALGIAALVAVVGLSESSKAQVNQQLAALGTNLLTATAGNSFGGEQAQLPVDAVAMVERIGPVQQAAGVGSTDARVYRNDKVDPIESGGIGVNAATESLKDTVGLEIAAGQWLSPATGQFPTAVLGATAADRLGITPELIRSGTPAQVWLGDRWFTVIGILDPSGLAPELDSSALVGWTAAETYLDFDGHPTTVYETSSDASVEAVRDVLAATVSPSAPDEVQVSRPSDALAAKAATDAAFTGLLLGLGAVSLLVGGVGVANTMVVSVLERRQEIGLRRALGATRRHIRNQFLGEAVALSVLGGIAGAVLGILVTAIFATLSGWPIAVPLWAIAAGLGVTVLVGVVAGIFPASRAAKLAPTAALSI